VKRWQHEDVSRPIGAHHHSRRLLAGESNAPTEAGSGYQLPCRSHGARVTIERTNTQHLPIEVAQARQSRDEDSMAFTRNQACDTEQRPNRAALRPQRPVRLCRTRWDHEDALERDAVSPDPGSRPRAGTNDTAKAVQRGSLEPNEAFRRRAGKPGFLGEWMVHERDEPQSAPVRYDRLFEIREREAVDYRRGAVGKFGQGRFTIIRAKLDDLYHVPARPQAVDDVTVVKITAGQLIEPARDDKDQFPHSSAAS
jgi:hypothetical protein